MPDEDQKYERDTGCFAPFAVALQVDVLFAEKYSFPVTPRSPYIPYLSISAFGSL